MRVRQVLLACVALAVPCSVALAGAGDPDPTFDGDGKITQDLGPGDAGVGVAVQSDGKILVAGGGAGHSLRVSRLNDTGSVDTSFGKNGSTDFDFGQLTETHAMAIAPDGKILLVGTTHFASGNADVAVARANPDGSPDTTFGPKGFREADMGQTGDAGTAVAQQPDGKVVIASAGDGSAVRIGRLDAGGHFDGSFVGGGVDVVPAAGVPFAMALQPDGKILVGGLAIPAGATGTNASDMELLRLTSGGTLDTSFNGTGKLTIDTGKSEEVLDIALQPDGKIVLSGRESATSMGVARVNGDGKVDQDFGDQGFTGIPFGTSALAPGVVLQQDGKVVVGGFGDGALAVARLQPGGSLDTTFSDDGKQTLDFNPNDQDFGRDVALAPNGAIVISGASGKLTVIGRLQPDSAGTGGGGGGGGGTGGQVPRCAGHRATIVGTSGRDRLVGTRRADVIVALGGSDRVSGGGGNDIICGGAGNDSISGGNGNDKLYGEDGRDSISGGAGNDKTSGGAGNDKLSGGAGNDRLSGGAGNDKLSGGKGKDRDSGGGGKDSCSGGESRSSC
jgi:uncharacterized delta-60 repeat protein